MQNGVQLLDLEQLERTFLRTEMAGVKKDRAYIG